jgi:hypothetical protein
MVYHRTVTAADKPCRGGLSFKGSGNNTIRLEQHRKPRDEYGNYHRR